VPVRKMRVEVYDESGNRYMISFEGRVTRDKALRILDIVELLGGMPGIETHLSSAKDLSKIEKVHLVVEKHLPLAWFSAKDVQPLYEKETGEPVSLSTASTFLSRLAGRGVLVKSRNSNRVLYRVISKDMKKLLGVP